MLCYVVNGASSESHKITWGVPQGLVLGPLLFLIYVNDLSNAVENNQLKIIAHDTNLCLYSDDMCKLEGRANNYLKEMELCFLVNKLSPNIDKHAT